MSQLLFTPPTASLLKTLITDLDKAFVTLENAKLLPDATDDDIARITKMEGAIVSATMILSGFEQDDFSIQNGMVKIGGIQIPDAKPGSELIEQFNSVIQSAKEMIAAVNQHIRPLVPEHE